MQVIVQKLASLIETHGWKDDFELAIRNARLSCAARFRAVIEPQPTVLVTRGEFHQHFLDRERITSDDIFSAMHKAGIADLRDAEWAILEGDGKIAIVPRPSRAITSDAGAPRPLGGS